MKPDHDISLEHYHTEMNDQRTTVFLDRYALKGDDGQPVESEPSQMWARVAHGIGQTDEECDDFRGLLQDFKFVPGGRILAGAGTDSEVTFYNCYVIPIETKARRAKNLMENEQFVMNFENATVDAVESFRRDMRRLIPSDAGSDSREAIFDTIGLMVDIMSRGGGVGINWSVLRPKGAYLKRVNGTTSGPVSWMDVASHAVGTVEQGGSRRGAAMFMLEDWHPDLLEFINAKRNLGVITNANVSIAVSDDFMESVREGKDWVFEFPDTTDSRYNFEWDGDLEGWKDRGGDTLTYGSAPAREVWRAISEAAHASGEPGLVFLSRYNAQSTGRGVERIISVNPCGEQGLGPYSVCNLGAMNLDAYVDPKAEGHFRWPDFQQDVKLAVRFLDNVIDENYYFLPENEKVQKELRRIGLSVMGLADALIGLGLRYGSDAAITWTDRLFHTMKVAAIQASVALAQEKGPAPAWDKKETWKRPYFEEFFQEDNPLGRSIRKHGLRNMFLLTQAPTGTTSILAGVNSGIEPYFAFEYTRKDRTGEHIVKAAAVEKYYEEGTYKPTFFVTSQDVTVEEHILMQAAVQYNVDSSVSKTINGPNSHTVDDVEKAYMMAYENGLKGVAYFRDGSGRDQVLYHTESVKQTVEKETTHEDTELSDLYGAFSELAPYLTTFERGEVLNGRTHKVATAGGTAYVTVNRGSDGRPVEVFFNVGKAGSETAALAEALGRLASLALRHGAALGGVANQLDGVGGSRPFNKPIPHAIAEALTLENGGGAPDVKPLVAIPVIDGTTTTWPSNAQITYTAGRADLCPECGQQSLVREEGCNKCHLCGYAAC